MTSQQLVDSLKASGLPAYLDAVPDKLSRYVAVHPYAESTIPGDGEHLCDIERVQIDVCAPARSDDLPNAVKNVLQNAFLMWETMTPMSYDPEFKLFRAILEVELY